MATDTDSSDMRRKAQCYEKAVRKALPRVRIGGSVVVGIQATVFMISIHHQRLNWTESVFQDYLAALSENLSNGLNGRTYSMISLEEILLRSADDRVSGLYIRNPDGTVAIATE